MSASAEALYSANYANYYSTIAADTDVIADMAVIQAALGKSNAPQRPCRGIIVGTAGVANVTLSSGQTIALTLAANMLYPIQISKILLASTTVAGVMVLF